MAEVTLNVSNKVAQLLENQAYAELVFRESNRKFDFFSKGLVTHTSSEALADGVAGGIEGLSVRNMRSICSRFDNGIDGIATKLDTIDSAAKTMAINTGQLIKQTHVTTVLSFMNAALSAVNIGVDIVGFKIMSDKLNELNLVVKDIKTTVAKLYNATVSEKLSDCEKLIMRFNAVSDHIQNDEVKDTGELENLLIDMNGYLSEMFRDMLNEVFDLENILEIIMRILPAYSIMFSEFLKRYFYKYNKRPNNYETFMNLYSEFFQNALKETLMDHFMIKGKVSFIDATDTLNTIRLLALNERTKVEDLIKLVEILETEESYKQVDRELEELAKRGVMLSA